MTKHDPLLRLAFCLSLLIALTACTKPSESTDGIALKETKEQTEAESTSDSSEQSASAQTDESWETYENKTYGYSISYQPGLYTFYNYLEEDEQPGDRTIVLSKKGREYKAHTFEVRYLNDPTVYVDLPLYTWLKQGRPENSPYHDRYPNLKDKSYGGTTYLCSLKQTETLAADNDCFIQSGGNWFWIINEVKNEADLETGTELMERLKF